MGLRTIDNDEPIAVDVEGSTVFVKPMNQGSREQVALDVYNLKDSGKIGEFHAAYCDILASWIVRIEGVEGPVTMFDETATIANFLCRVPDDQIKMIRKAIMGVSELSDEERVNLPSAPGSPVSETSAPNPATDTTESPEAIVSITPPELPASDQGTQKQSS